MLVRTARDLGALARERRKELRWSQTELAERIGTSRSWVSDLENGKERAEIGLTLKALQVLGLMVEVREPHAEPRVVRRAHLPLVARPVSRIERSGDAGGGRPPLTRGGKRLSAARGVRSARRGEG
ncbi:MAG TPA: helix-turn-helix domain-containing protein [Longimicrobium sp.]|jgi:y4mF family transcriptional regulator